VFDLQMAHVYNKQLIAAAHANVILMPFKNPDWRLLPRNFCAEKHNKWECYFLPATNCTLPAQVLDEKGAMRYADKSNHPPTLFNLTDNTLVPDEFALTRNHHEHDQHLEERWGIAVGYLLRLNHATRARVSEMKARFLARNAWHAGDDKCVVIHARRGDKMTGSDPHDPAFQQIPGFNKTFDFYIQTAKEMLTKINGKQTIFFMTDDKEWMEENVGKYKDLNIYSLGGNGQPDLNSNVEQVEKDSGMFDVLLSLELASRCSGLVGNSASSMYWMVYYYMCFVKSKCPMRFTCDERIAKDAIPKLQQYFQQGASSEQVFEMLGQLASEPGYKRDTFGTGFYPAGQKWEDLAFSNTGLG
jgi:hypothetical protein